MKLEGQEESANVEDRRGIGLGRGAAGLGGVGLVLVLLISLLFHKDPAQVAEVIKGAGEQGTEQSQPVDPAEEQAAKFTKVILRDTEVVWGERFKGMGRTYRDPTLVLFSGLVESACGQAAAAVGPFYCPGERSSKKLPS